MLHDFLTGSPATGIGLLPEQAIISQPVNKNSTPWQRFDFCCNQGLICMTIFHHRGTYPDNLFRNHRCVGGGQARCDREADEAGLPITVRYRPGSAEARKDNQRWRSVQPETVRSGSGRIPRRHARRMSSEPSKFRSRSAPKSFSPKVNLEFGKGIELLFNMVFQHLLHGCYLD